MAIFGRKAPAYPIDVIGVLLNPQNIGFWTECWCLPNALEASGLPVSLDGDRPGWTYGSTEVQQSGDVFLMLLKSPAGNIWEAKWTIDRGDMVRYHFLPHDDQAPQTGDEAKQLKSCCQSRGGCL
jgi:hypothetical protein